MSSGRCEWRLLTNLTEGREVQQSDSTHLDRYLGGGICAHICAQHVAKFRLFWADTWLKHWGKKEKVNNI